MKSNVEEPKAGLCRFMHPNSTLVVYATLTVFALHLLRLHRCGDAPLARPSKKYAKWRELLGAVNPRMKEDWLNWVTNKS